MPSKMANGLRVTAPLKICGNGVYLFITHRSLHEQCHQLRGWGVVYLLYLLACAYQYRHLINIGWGRSGCQQVAHLRGALTLG
jgi:hypothetical protein